MRSVQRVLGNRARYNRMARIYQAFARSGGLGRLHRAVTQEIDHEPGGVIVDLGCGPATLTPYLLPKVWPGGTVIGVDVADSMISRARELAAERSWKGVEFVRSDARDFAPRRPVDSVVFCLSLSTMPDPEHCLEQAVSWLKPGGRLVVLDSIPDEARPFAKLVMHLKAPLVGAQPTRAPIDFAAANLEEVKLQHFLGGAYTLLSARTPKAAA